MKIRSLAAPVLVVCALAGCASDMNAMLETVQNATKVQRGAANPRLNPNYRFLRVTVDGRVAFLALGNEDSDPRGPVEVWYSRQREVLRFQNGRLVGAVGMTTEWRNVVLPELPSWSALAGAQQPFKWTRVRDVMPGYRYGVRDELALRATSPPQKSALQNLDPQSLHWFEEQTRPGPGQTLPPARYAVELRDGKETAVYGEQCLAVGFCFTWQRWN